MKREIDARGHACPQPVIMAKKAIEESGDCVVIVDNMSARENVCRMAGALGCTADVQEVGTDSYIHITGQTQKTVKRAEPSTGPSVVVFPSARMGRGDDELGLILIRTFIHTLGETFPRPDVMIFFNTGVKLTTEGSDVFDDLQALEQLGVRMLVCGTCLDYFNLKNSIRAGIISNMYDIAETMLSAGRVIRL